MSKHATSNMPMMMILTLTALMALAWLSSDVPHTAHAAPNLGWVSHLPQAGTVMTVCASGCDYSNIQDAVEAAPSGAEIKIAEGVYTDTHTSATTPLVNITQPLTLRGGYRVADWNTSDPINYPTTLDGRGKSGVVYTGPGVTATVENLRITGGNASGGLVAGGPVTVSHCVIFNNRGVGVSVGEGATVSANTVTANAGGGVHVSGNAGLDNNTIFANTGDGVNVVGASPILRHNTIVRNTGDGVNVAVWQSQPSESLPFPPCYPSSVNMMNNIVVGHTVGVRSRESQSYCHNTVFLWGTLWGVGEWANQTDWIGPGVWDNGINLHGDPAFLDPAAGNYHISKGSAARDASGNAGLAIDADDDPRPYGPAYDIGADEYGWNHAPYIPRNPAPRDGAVSQPLWPTLSCQGSDPDYDPVTYTVAFGPINPPPVVTTTPLTSFGVTGLISDTTYYWAITATDGLSITSGTIWSFTTAKDFFILPLIVKVAPP